MQEGTLAEILDWSAAQPPWQRDALHRLFTAGPLTVPDLDELLDLAKAKHGLIEPREAAPLETAHLAIGDGSTAPISLLSVTHHQGVNALAPEQTVTSSTSQDQRWVTVVAADGVKRTRTRPTGWRESFLFRGPPRFESRDSKPPYR